LRKERDGQEKLFLEITLTPALSLKKGEGVISGSGVGLFDLPNDEILGTTTPWVGRPRATHIYYGDHTLRVGVGLLTHS